MIDYYIKRLKLLGLKGLTTLFQKNKNKLMGKWSKKYFSWYIFVSVHFLVWYRVRVIHCNSPNSLTIFLLESGEA